MFADRDHPEFIGVNALIEENANQLMKFRIFAERKDWNSFHGSHYDWWAFPIDAPSSYGFRYSVSKESVEALKRSTQFLANLSECADLLLLSWGWNPTQNESLSQVDEGQTWAHWPIRLYKSWRSMQIFGLQDKEALLKSYAHHLRRKGVSFEYQGRDLFEAMVS